MLYTMESGSPASPAIVFLHAGPLSSKMWQPQIERLPDFYCLAPDLPEHGHSREIQPFTLEDAAQRVAELIRERVPAKKAHVVGVSLGGAVLLTLLRSAPMVVDHAMVSGTAARLDRFTGNLAIAMLPAVRLMKPETSANAMVRQMGVPEEYRPLFYDDFLAGASEAYARRVYQALLEMELPEKVEQPLLVAVGEKETGPAKSAAKKLLRLYPKARGIQVPGLGHLWNLQDPDLFSASVRAWVQDAPLPEKLRPLTQA